MKNPEPGGSRRVPQQAEPSIYLSCDPTRSHQWQPKFNLAQKVMHIGWVLIQFGYPMGYPHPDVFLRCSFNGSPRRLQALHEVAEDGLANWVLLDPARHPKVHAGSSRTLGITGVLFKLVWLEK